jgi:hypothetical protein
VYKQSQVGEGDLDFSEITYQGDLAFDIDEGDLGKAIESTVALIEALEAVGVKLDCCLFYASGGKGFHVIVPATLFSPGKAEKRLPLVHRYMVDQLISQFGLHGIDMGVYAWRRGHMLRAPGLRPDGETHKTLLQGAQMVRGMTPDFYKQVVRVPSILQPSSVSRKPGKEDEAAELYLLYDQGRKWAEWAAKIVATKVDINPEVEKHFKWDGPPACMDALIRNEGIRPDTQFNKIALNVAAWVRAIDYPKDQVHALIDNVAAAYGSRAYRTQADRRQHLRSLLEGSKDWGMRFNCTFMKALLQTSPCRGCPLQSKMKEQVSMETGVVQRGDGYYRVTSEGEVRLTNFVLVPEFLSRNEEGMLQGTLCSVSREEGLPDSRKLLLTPEVWIDGRSFKGGIKGLEYAIYDGSDQDLGRIKALIHALQEDELEEVSIVHTHGIHRHKGAEINGAEVYVYVDPKGSVNTYGVRGTHAARAQSDTDVADLASIAPAQGKEDEEALLHLLSSNRPEVVGQVLGWMAACHLKTQAMAVTRMFPLLHIYGAASAGKSLTASVYAALAGADYSENGPLNVEGATPFPLRAAGCSTTTIPKILDEVNKTKIQQGKYNLVRDILKASFTRNKMAMGGIGGKKALTGSTATVTDYPVTAPLVFLATQRTAEAELYERSIEVFLSPVMQDEREHRAHFEALSEGPSGKRLFRWASLLMRYALRVREEQFRSWYGEEQQRVPPKFRDRTRKSFSTVLVGLRFLQSVIEDRGFSPYLLDELGKVREGMMAYWEKSEAAIATRKKRSEVTLMVSRFLEMSEPIDQGLPVLQRGAHWHAYQDIVYLKAKSLVPSYLIYMRRLGLSPEITDLGPFMELIEHEPYYVSYGLSLPPEVAVLATQLGQTVTGPWLGLDLPLLREQGLVVTTWT